MRSPRCAFWLLPVLLLFLVPAASTAQVSITVNFAPPELPVYDQPPCPEQGWMWTPGYWAYDDDGYYWVPGEWVPAPYEGAMWTPPWWGWDDGRYVFHEGYWGDQVGYYGGIDYGFGYMGVGFAGGEWRDGRFAYNTAVMHVDRDRVRDTYEDRNIVRNYTVPDERRVAFNGGPNGIRHDPTPRERAAMSVRHAPPTPVQTQHIQAARTDRSLYAKANGGHPRTLAVQRPGELNRNPNNVERPNGGSRAVPQNVPGSRTEPTPRPESRMPEARPGRTTPETSRPTERPETRPVPNERPRPETRPAPPPRTESRPESRPQPHPEPRTESRPAPPRTETRPAPEARPAPQRETRPTPPVEARPAPQRESRPAPRYESRPAPPARQESRPAPAARPAPQHESRPAPAARPEKPKSDEKPHE